MDAVEAVRSAAGRRRHAHRHRGRAVSQLLGLVVALVALATPAAAQPAAAVRDITPGVRMVTPLDGREAVSCTAAFVFRTRASVYLGYAAHCAARDADASRNGCRGEPLPLGSPVTVIGRDRAQVTGRVAFSSWRTMQQRGETDQALCELNDFALVALDPAAVARVDPTVPELGGPTGLDTDGTVPGEPVVSYQPNNPGPTIKRGLSLGVGGAGRTHRVRTSPAGVPGDSGSGYLDRAGRAFGVLSTQFKDGTGTNGVADLAKALEYANRYGGLGTITLVDGTAAAARP
jgi:hypothetical protein